MLALPAAAQKKSGMKFAPDPVKSAPATGPASKTLERALKLYENEDYYSASIELHKVIEGESGDSEANKQRGEFWMGKTLYNLKFYSASLSYFDRIVQKGPAHSYYNATLKWLSSLSRVLPDSAGILEKIGKYNKGELEQPALESVRNELYYLLGRYFYTQGKFKEAVDLFAQVPLDSEFFVKAKFFEGVTHVRERDGKGAAESFKDILRKNQEKPDKSTEEFVDVANLALARTFYSTGQFQTAVKYFEKIGQDSPDWLPSLFESSWAYFQLGAAGYSKALGNIHTLNAPFFENEFFPESLILKSVIYFYNCLYDKSQEALNEFAEVYPSLKKDIDDLLARHPDNSELNEYATKIREGTAGLPDKVERAARGVLQDRTLLKQLAYVEELERELKQVESAEPAWKSTAVAANILQDLTLQKSLSGNEVGKLARERLQRLSAEIGEFEKQRLKIEFEILNAQKGQLTQDVMSEQETKPNIQQPRNFIADDEHEYWPFVGEYWKDELGYYRVRVASQCRR
ncbi:MAG TPA: tetratricopeptide repeat protein [Polyangia bacterium]|nr:tetratricopeptide repeat protein [Polyangia bacterium]